MLQVVCQSAPDNDRANEDAFVAYQRNDGQPEWVLAAIDGATSVAFYEPLVDYLHHERHGVSPAALAASITRNAILSHLGTLDPHDEIHPTQLLLHANQTLRTLLDRVASGIYDLDAIIAVNPAHAKILDDRRKIRLFLPAAVATIAVIDTQLKTLYFAHVGDTALILGYRDGRVEVPTLNQVRMNYESALFAAVKQVAGDGLSMLDVINHPLIQALNRDQRINHNFVDEQGATHLSRGTGVVNGLPELADYIKTGVVSLEGVEAIILASDGFLWPDNPLNPTPDPMRLIGKMWQMIRQQGAMGYLNALRLEERADATREKYPRFKLHDDATGVILNL